MRCPWCLADDDRVVDSRGAEDGAAIRRRRECNGCGHRFTTYERIDEVPLMITKRSGLREPFRREKVVAGLRSASKNRPIPEEALQGIAARVEDAVREAGAAASSQMVGLSILESLGALDEVAYLRFASVYKGFTNVEDFRREARLLTKATEPKLHGD